MLLLVDGYHGFEMETFEFLNILQAHGFPKVMGVLTHLDMFKSAKTLRKTKKMLKQRFWTEIYQVRREMWPEMTLLECPFSLYTSNPATLRTCQ